MGKLRLDQEKRLVQGSRTNKPPNQVLEPGSYLQTESSLTPATFYLDNSRVLDKSQERDGCFVLVQNCFDPGDPPEKRALGWSESFPRLWGWAHAEKVFALPGPLPAAQQLPGLAGLPVTALKRSYLCITFPV